MLNDVELVGRSSARFQCEFGEFELRGYEFAGGSENAALISIGSSPESGPPLVRLQSACLTGTAFHAMMCDCRQQLQESLTTIACRGGCVIYLDQDGRGHGLVEKVAQLDAIARGANTYEAALHRGVEPDVRNFAQSAFVLNDIYGPTPVRLLTNNPEKLDRAKAAGIAIAGREPIEPEPTASNRDYLAVKKAFMGHILTKV